MFKNAIVLISPFKFEYLNQHNYQSTGYKWVKSIKEQFHDISIKIFMSWFEDTY
jgi:hypothetical protein